MISRLIALAFFYFLVTLFSSCDFESVVDVDIPKETPKLVVNSVLMPDSIIRVNVTLSRHILEEDYWYQLVSNANVMVTGDNGTIATLPFHEGNQEYYLEGFTAQEGVTYMLEISANGYEPVTASTFVNSKVAVTKIEKGGKGIIEKEETPSTIFWLYFQDPGDQANYYRIKVTATNVWTDPWSGEEIVYESQVFISSTDPSISKDYYNGDELVFSDVLFEGKDHRIPVLIPDYVLDPNPTRLVFYLETLNEHLYNYTETKALQEYVDGDPFAQPVLVYNNIKKGFGIFGAYSPFKMEYTP